MTRITLPLVLPAILTAMNLTIINNLVVFGPAALIGIPAKIYVMASQIYVELTAFPPRLEFTAALAMLFLTFAALLLTFQMYVLRRRNFSTIVGKGMRPREMALGRWRWVACALFGLVVCITLAFPAAILVFMSFSKVWTNWFAATNFTLAHYENVLFTRTQTLAAIGNTLLLALVTVATTLTAGFILAYIIVKTRSRARQALNYLTFLPYSIPGAVFTVSVILAFIRPPLVLYGTLWILVVCYFARFLPFAIQPLSAVHCATDRRLPAGGWPRRRRGLVAYHAANHVAAGEVQRLFDHHAGLRRLPARGRFRHSAGRAGHRDNDGDRFPPVGGGADPANRRADGDAPRAGHGVFLDHPPRDRRTNVQLIQYGHRRGWTDMIDRRTSLIGAVVALTAGLPRIGHAEDGALVSKAKSEGEVTFYTSADTLNAEACAAAFKKRYGINVKLFRAGGSQIAQKLTLELRTRRLEADLTEMSDAAMLSMLFRQGAIDPYEAANGASLPDGFKHPKRAWYGTAFNFMHLIVNKDKVSTADEPKTWADIADPKWKGKLVWGSPNYGSSQYATVKGLIELHGWELIEKMKANQTMIIQGWPEAENAVASGERLVGGDASARSFRALERGAPLRNVYPADGAIVALGAASVMKGA